MQVTAVKVVGPRDGTSGFLGSIGVRFMIDGDEAGQRCSLVEHPMSARALAAPCTATRARTSTATCSRAAWAHCSATTS